MNIACSINRTFIHPLCVMLHSLHEHTLHYVKVFILHTELREDDIDYINNILKEDKRLELVFLKVKTSTSALSNLKKLRDGLSVETYYRLLLPLELPIDVGKVIYIDADIVVNDDVMKLYELDIENDYLGAVVEICEQFYQTTKLKSIIDYFNAGVLLINLKKWRVDNFLNMCLLYAAEHPERIVMEDQDILNGTLNGTWKRVPLKWNVTRNLIFNKKDYYQYLDHEEVDNAIEQPSLIHYTSNFKPWKLIDNHPYQYKYMHYLEQLHLKTESKRLEAALIDTRKIVLFGTGKKAEEYKQVLDDLQMKIECCVDNNSLKWGKDFDGLPIKSPNELTHSPQQYYVIIASQYVDEISAQLNEYGYVKSDEGYIFE